jgi:hypothetical protein
LLRVGTSHNHHNADIIGGLQDDVSKENTTSKCHHRPFRSPDLSFHPKDLPCYSKSITTSPSTRKSTLERCQYCIES